MGFDAPETFQAKCDAELALGKRAAERLKELLASGCQRRSNFRPARRSKSRPVVRMAL